MNSCSEKIARRIAAWASLLLIVLGGASATRAQSSEIDALAADVATTIRYRYKYLDSSPRVLVEDIQDDQRSESDLRLTLADEFQRALKARQKDFFVIDRPERPKPHELSAQELDDLQASCPVPVPKQEPGPDIRIRGYYQVYPGNDVSLRIDVLLDRAVLAEHNARLTLTPDLLRHSAPPEPEPDRLRGKILWLREPGKDKTEEPVRLPRAGEKGYTMPSCVYCPNPTFSNEASHAQAEGTVLFDVELDAEGQMAAIAVVKPLPCGLTEKALDAIKHWKLKPALGPIEVTFRLY
jgi:TonB-like protein